MDETRKMFLTQQRLERRMRELENFRFIDLTTISPMTAQRRAVVISESKDGGYGLLLDPRRTTVTQIAGGDGGALTLHVETKEVSWHLPRRGEGHITLAYTLLLGTQALSALRLELTLTKEEKDV